MTFGFMCTPLEIQLSRGECWGSQNWLKPATFCACRKPRLGFTITYVVIFFVFNDFR